MAYLGFFVFVEEYYEILWYDKVAFRWRRLYLFGRFIRLDYIFYIMVVSRFCRDERLDRVCDFGVVAYLSVFFFGFLRVGIVRRGFRGDDWLIKCVINKNSEENLLV